MNTRLLLAILALAAGTAQAGTPTGELTGHVIDIDGDEIVLSQGWRLDRAPNPERYADPTDNPFLGGREHPLSTFSIDVDTASYASIGRFLRSGAPPPPDAVRIEELVNHFSYTYLAPIDAPMAVSFEVNDCPWNDEARLVRIGLRGRALSSGLTSNTVARDVKVQVELNPDRVVAYRLIGHEDRTPRLEDLDDDHEDAGALGAGETVTALYEIIPANKPSGADLLTVEARYELPGGWFGRKHAWAARDGGLHLAQASADFRFAAAVAAFGMILRSSPHRGTADHDLVLRLAGEALGDDHLGDRREFLELVRQSRELGAEHGPVSRR
jgi:hypothetical protein